MTDVQEVLLELLTDIDTICKREKIKYSLCAETAHAAFTQKAFHPSCCEASVAMTTKDALKFIDAVKKENRADRIVDSMANNKGYPDFTVRYGNPNTLLVHLPYYENSGIPCIAVTIHMIRYKPKHCKKFFKYSSAFWKACNRPVASFSNPTVRLAATACHFVRNVFGASNVSRWLFKKWCALFSSNKKAKKISVSAGSYSYNADLLHCEDILELEGKTFTVFGYIDTYLKTAYGSAFQTKVPQYLKPSSALLISTRISYKDYLARAKEMNVDFAAAEKNQRKLDSLKQKVSAYNKIIDRYYSIVDRTDKRFAMYEKYMPMKKLLLKLRYEERYEVLKELLQPYYDALSACSKKGLGLCFDKEIFEIAMDVLRNNGQYTYANKLRALVPEQHWEPMVVTDYRGELVEITDISELMPEYSSTIEEHV